MIQHMLLRLALAQASDASEAVTSAPAETQPAQSTTAAALKHLQTWFGPTFEHTSLAGWAGLIAAIFVGLLLGKLAQSILRSSGDKLKSRGWKVRSLVLKLAASPANLAIFALCLQLGLTFIYAAEKSTVASLREKSIGLLLVVALAWFLYNLVDLVEIAIRKVTDDDTIVVLIRKTLRIFLLIVFAMFVAQNTFGANISAWLAGLGLAGLAVSLAAQGPIKNIFGSVTVVLDRPFGLGDTIKYGDVTGTVETMGFRSTKLRTADGHLVTIPNMKLIDDVVENISARPSIRRNFAVNLTCDTPPAKVEQAISILTDLLREPFMADTFDAQNPPRVYFTALNADSLNIQVTYWYQLGVQGRDPWTQQAQCQEFNLKLLRAFAEAGIELAYPSQTIYLAGDANRRLSVHLAHNGEDSLVRDIRAGAAH